MRIATCASLGALLCGGCWFAPTPAACVDDRHCPDDLSCRAGQCGGPDAPPNDDDDAGGVPDDDGGFVVDAGVPCDLLPSLTVTTAGDLDVLDDATCVRITGDLVVEDYFGALDRLAPVVEVGGDLVVRDTNGVVRLDGMEGIAAVAGSVTLTGNSLLNDVAALAGARVDGDLTITNNAVLRTCDAEALAAALVDNGLGGTATVQSNLFDSCT